MASQQIDELQLKIGSDATSAIKQLSDLSTALTNAASAASAFSSANNSLSSLASSLTKIANVDLTKTINGLRSFRKSFDGKTIKMDFQINGTDQLRKVANSMQTIGTANLRNSGVTQFTNAMARLAGVDMTKINSGSFGQLFDKLKDGTQTLSNLGGVSNSLNRFVSSIARLANAGDKTGKTANYLKVLTPELENTIKSMQNAGAVDETINSFVASLARLATAGDKAGDTAANLGLLRDAVVDFLTAISNAPQIDTNLAMTIQGLGNLAQAGSKAGSVMSNLGKGTGGGSFFSVLKQSANSTANVLKKLLNVSLNLGKKGLASVGSFFKTLGLIPGHADNVDRLGLSFGNLFRAVVPFYGLRGVFGWLKEAVETGASIVEVENVVDTMFGTLGKGYEDLSGLVYKWAQGTIDAFGVSELAARQYAGKIMAMFNSSGFDATEGMRDKAAEMSMNLVQLAGDLASFYDIEVDEAMTKIQAGLAGMNRPLRSLGINLSVANLQQHALSMGITETWKNMDQATQMLVRYDYLMNAAQYAVGDFSKTQHTFANQTRLLALNFQVLGATIGQGLISAIAPAITWINALIRRLIQAANAFRTFMFTIFGKAIGAAKGVVNDLAGYADDAADAIDGIGDSGGGLGGAAKSAKDLAKQLSVLPFDELNQLAKDTSSAGSGGGSGSGGGGGVGGLGDLWGDSFLDATDLDGSEIGEAFSKWGQQIKNAFLAEDWSALGMVIADGINRGFNKLHETLSWDAWEPRVMGFITPFSETVNSMAHFINWDNIGRTFSTGLNTITYTLDAWFAAFDWKYFGSSFARLMNGALDEWDAPAFGKMLADKFMIGWKAFSGWVDTFDFKLAGTKIKEALIEWINNVDWNDIGNSLGKFITGLADMFNTVFEDGEVKDAVYGAIGTMFEGLKDGINMDTVKSAFSSLFEAIPWGVVLAGTATIFAAEFGKTILGTVLQAEINRRLFGLNFVGTGGTGAAGAAGAGGGTSLISKLGGAGGLAALGIAGGLFLGSASYANEHGATSSDYIRENNITPNFDTRGLDMSAFTKHKNEGSGNKSGSSGLANTSVTATTIFAGKILPSFTKGKEEYSSVVSETATKGLIALAEPSLHREGDYYHGIASNTATKTANALATAGLRTVGAYYHGIVDDTATKIGDGLKTIAFNTLNTDYHGIFTNTATKTAEGKRTGEFNTTYDRYTKMNSKDVYVNLRKGSNDLGEIAINGSSGVIGLLGRAKISWNAQGGIFTQPVVMQGFGEAGPEAALPLRNKKSMSMIASAITKSGGYGGNIDADRIARTIAAAVISAMTSQNERPVNVNAVLYTENNEVLARAVDAGRRSIDKRYNPVSRVAYS